MVLLAPVGERPRRGKLHSALLRALAAPVGAVPRVADAAAGLAAGGAVLRDAGGRREAQRAGLPRAVAWKYKFKILTTFKNSIRFCQDLVKNLKLLGIVLLSFICFLLGLQKGLPVHKWYAFLTKFVADTAVILVF